MCLWSHTPDYNLPKIGKLLVPLFILGYQSGGLPNMLSCMQEAVVSSRDVPHPLELQVD